MDSISGFLIVVGFLLFIGSPLVVLGGAGAYASWRVLSPTARGWLQRKVGDSALVAVSWFATTWAVAWLMFYACVRVSGIVPRYAEWQRSGYRHGPWDASIMVYVLPSAITLLAVLLPISALSIGAVDAGRRRTPTLAAKGVGVAVLSVSYAWLMAYWMYWLVD